MATTDKPAASRSRSTTGTAPKATRPVPPQTLRSTTVITPDAGEKRIKKVIVPPPKPKLDGDRGGPRTPGSKAR